MNFKTDKCQYCGSQRVVSGKMQGFVLSEAKRRSWYRFFMSAPPHRPGPVIRVGEPGGAILCLECGKVIAEATADVKEATHLVHAWGTEKLRKRLSVF